MRVPLRLSPQSPWRKVLAAAGAAVLAVLVAQLVLRLTSVADDSGFPADPAVPAPRLNLVSDAFYKWFYNQRPVQSRQNSSTVIVAVDQKSLDFVDQGPQLGWPWPRDYWAFAIKYLERVGARAVVFDLIFSERGSGDKVFAKAINEAKIPIIFANKIGRDQRLGRFRPPVTTQPIFGIVNATGSGMTKEYQSIWAEYPSLAMAVVKAVGRPLPDWAQHRFNLLYYGPDQNAKGEFTFRQIGAAPVALAGAGKSPGSIWDLKPDDFRGKIVLIGGSAAGTYDLKNTPLGIFPGVELNATAIENLLENRHVELVGADTQLGTAVLMALGSACVSMFPKQVWLKLIGGFGCVAAVVMLSRVLFLQSNPQWLDPAPLLLAVVLAFIFSLGWSYFIEDRQARLFIKAFGQCISPVVAEEIRADPTKLMLSTAKEELSILFSDIAHFTDISEALGERVGALLNFYLNEMSGPVFQFDGYLDKYIGDAVMALWNVPTKRENHAVLACRAALAMKKRLVEIQPQLAELGASGVWSRIGVNTGSSTYGMMGSTFKSNYSAIGDPVNYASRLEGANKIYGSTILLGETTAKIVRSDFVIRKLDVLQVQGKQPAAVYELLAEGVADKSLRQRVEIYELAFAQYLAREWDEAEKFLLELVKQFPDDAPARVLLERIADFRLEPPLPGWDGVFVAKSK